MEWGWGDVSSTCARSQQFLPVFCCFGLFAILVDTVGVLIDSHSCMQLALPTNLTHFSYVVVLFCSILLCTQRRYLNITPPPPNDAAVPKLTQATFHTSTKFIHRSVTQSYTDLAVKYSEERGLNCIIKPLFFPRFLVKHFQSAHLPPLISKNDNNKRN